MEATINQPELNKRVEPWGLLSMILGGVLGATYSRLSWGISNDLAMAFLVGGVTAGLGLAVGACIHHRDIPWLRIVANLLIVSGAGAMIRLFGPLSRPVCLVVVTMWCVTFGIVISKVSRLVSASPD